MNDQVLVGIIMGSQSDWETMKNAAKTLDGLGVAYETRVVSAHRTPDRMFEYAEQAADRGLQVIIAGAGTPHRRTVRVELSPAVISRVICSAKIRRCRCRYREP